MNGIPPSVQKPSRYSGCEVRPPLVPWEESRTRVLLAFPDVYEIGMSHLGLLLLHRILNARPATRCERVFAPWTDMEEHIRSSGSALASLESGRPARDFDILGFSLTYELTYTNVLSMLSLSGIPLLRGDRREGDPLVLCGGVCTLNPAPVAEFFDAMVVGDGEEAVLEILSVFEDGRMRGRGREEILRDLSRIEGVYVPGVSPRVSRRVLRDLAESPLLPSPILPAMRVVHDRLSVEVSRGCTRGCRFCQAGYVYRPVRERDPLLLLRYLQETAPRTGYDEVGLLSLSTADYSCVDRLITDAMETLSPERISISLPSLRLDALKENTVRQIRRVRKTGFTLAPEAGTERLRRSVNKDIPDDDVFKTAEFIYGNGWQTLKLYFMVGLPGETAEDVAAIGRLAKRVGAIARRHGRRNSVTVSLSAFIPKPHTPFQWERQIGRAEIEERVAIVKSAVGRDRNVDVKYHSPAVSELEGVFSRGDERLSKVIRLAYEAGARFDAWTEAFRPDAWRQAFDAAGIDPLEYLEERPVGRPLPWEFVDAGVGREFLLAEREKARAGEATPDCRTGECSACGACPTGLSNITYASMADRKEEARGAEGPSPPPAEPSVRYVVRLRYSKEGPARFLSGLEVQSLWGRILRRAGLPVAYSQGFHPAPRLSFSAALPVGTESLAELVEAEFFLPVPADEIRSKLPPCLPEGMSLIDAQSVAPGMQRLSGFDLACTYRIVPSASSSLPAGVTQERAREAWDNLLASASFRIQVERDGKRSEVDLKPLVSNFMVNGEGVSITIIQGTGKGIRPLEAASRLLGVEFPPEIFIPKKISADLVPRRVT